MQLSTTSIHVWKIKIEQHDNLLNQALSILNDDEKLRCKKVKLYPHQKQYMIMRTALRIIISDYLRVSPAAVTFHYNKHGKPALVNLPLHFNLSHTASLGVIAIAKQKVGVDIERVRYCNALAIAKRFFHPDEFKQLSACAPPQQVENFCQLWAKKEAIIKAMGTSFASAAKYFAVLLNEDQQQITVNNHHWYVQALNLAFNYKSAVASEHFSTNISFYCF